MEYAFSVVTLQKRGFVYLVLVEYETKTGTNSSEFMQIGIWYEFMEITVFSDIESIHTDPCRSIQSLDKPLFDCKSSKIRRRSNKTSKFPQNAMVEQRNLLCFTALVFSSCNPMLLHPPVSFSFILLSLLATR